LHNDFIFDDKVIVENNKLLKKIGTVPAFCCRGLSLFSFENFKILQEIFTSNYWANTPYEKTVVLYRPLVITSYAIDYSIWGSNPFGFHLTNVILNSINSVLLFVFFLSLRVPIIGTKQSLEKIGTVPIFSIFCIVLFFSVHTIHTETVNEIVGRTELLSFCFSFLSLIFYYLSLRGVPLTGQRSNLVLSLFFFLLALLSKESAIILPFIIIICDNVIKKRDCPRFLLSWTVPFFIVAIIYFLIRSLVLGSIFSSNQSGIFQNLATHTKIATIIKSLGFYLRLLVYPVGLSPDYNDFKLSKSLFEIGPILSIISIVFFGFLVFRNRFKNQLITLGILWIFIGLLPVSNIFFPIGAILGERFLYFPSAGFCLIIAGFIVAKAQSNKGTKFLYFVPLCLCACVFTVLTFSRNFDYKDNFTLWNKTIQFYPDNVKAHFNIAEHYAEKGEIEKALIHYNKSIGDYPDNIWKPDKNSKSVVYNKIGVIYANSKGQNQLDLAIKSYKDSIGLNPNNSDAYYNLGLSYYKKRLFNDAKIIFLKSLELNPENSSSYVCLGNIEYQFGNKNKAIQNYKKAIEINPDNFEAKKNLEILLQY
jgi:tetratricopeptide (TPR) repeat protein